MSARSIDVDDTPVADLGGAFDVVVANILAPVLIASAPDLRRLTDREGVLIISGILATPTIMSSRRCVR